VWKIIYMMMLGVEVDFGHMEAVNLISSSKYSEKNVVGWVRSPYGSWR
jgi:AP-2 complex subunit alpha